MPRAAALLPPQLQKVILLNTGSESNEAAIRMAKLATGGHEVVGRYGVVPRPDRRRRGRDLFGRTARLRPGDPRQHGDPGAQRLPLPDPPLHGRLRSGLPRGRLRAGRCPALRPAAAAIAEPILSTGGVIVPPPGYFPRLKELCEARGMLLILDEAQTAFGRVGANFAFEQDGVVPGFPRGVEDPRRRRPARRGGDQRRDRGDLLPSAASSTSPRTSPTRCRLRSGSRCSRCCAASGWPSARSSWAGASRRPARPAAALRGDRRRARTRPALGRGAGDRPPEPPTRPRSSAAGSPRVAWSLASR